MMHLYCLLLPSLSFFVHDGLFCRLACVSAVPTPSYFSLGIAKVVDPLHKHSQRETVRNDRTARPEARHYILHITSVIWDAVGLAR
uniref:Putative secreted protein n=1 Tax=Anopheles triannulatus TaxID=58253 RepID=A0A2M4B7G9_9DIPT